MVISLYRMRRAWFWVKLVAVLLLLALILPPAFGWVRRLMYSAATTPPASEEEVLTPAGSEYGAPAGGLLGRLIEVLRNYYQGKPPRGT